VQYIQDNRGKHFNPELVKLFQKALPDILLIKEQFADPDPEDQTALIESLMV
jgi:response regulator RpfG family c-di-GMP phosphodiesterase